MNPRTQQIAMRYARKLAIKRMCRKWRKYGKVLFSTTILGDDFTERSAVDEALREEQTKRGLR